MMNRPYKILNYPGSLEEIGKHAKDLGCKPLIITGGSARYFDEIKKYLEDAGIYVNKDDCFKIENEPRLSEAEAFLEKARNSKYDSMIGIGGGSVLDTAKVVAAVYNNPGKIADYLIGNGRTMEIPSFPKILVPTTAGSGSEVTRVSVLIDDRNDKNHKAVVYDNQLYADLAILDGTLTVNLPHDVTVNTGIDAFVHAFEAFTSTKANDKTDELARNAMCIISNHITCVVDEPENIYARQAMLEASSMAGSAFINSSSGSVHGLGLPINSRYKIPHGRAMALMLPHVSKYNVSGTEDDYKDYATADKKFKRVKNILGEDSLVSGITSLLKSLNIPLKVECLNAIDIKEISNTTFRLNRRLFDFNVRKIRSPKDIEEIYISALNGIE